MAFWFSNSDNRDTKVNGLLNSFRTPFWREKHRWFFRCRWNQSSIANLGSLYTLPGIIDELDDSPENRFESTCPDNNISHDLYDRVRIFKYWSEQTNLCPDFMVSYPKFRDIHHLKIKLPFNDNLWKFVSTLNQLNKLDVTMDEGSTYSQLQTLIDQAPHLYSLSIAYLYDLPITPSTFTITNASIRRVEFLPPISFYTKYMNKGKCMAFANSPLGRQCEVLILHLETHTFVIDLIKKMPKLRSLTFMCQGDRWKGISQFETKNNIIQWLRENNLPSSVSIIDSNQSSFI